MTTPTDLLSGRIPPHSLDAERAVLGNCLWGRPEVLARVRARLTPEDFYLERHRVLFATIATLAEAGRGVDLITVAGALRDAGYTEIEGQAPGLWLETLWDESWKAVLLEDYLGVVLREAGRREAIRVCADGIASAYDGAAPRAILDRLQGFAAIVEREEDGLAARPALGAQPIGQVLTEVVASLDREETDYVPTPVPELSKRLAGGLLPGEVAYLGGRPGVSKSSLALQWAVLAGEYGLLTLVVSREMKNAALGRRVLAQQTQVGASALRRRALDEHERRRIDRALPRLAALPIWFDDEAESIGQIRRLVRRLRPRFLVVDYVQLVRAPEAKVRRLEVTAVSAGLKQSAMRYGCSVLGLSSMRRLPPPEKGKGGKRLRLPPTLDDLKESGDLEADADVVVLLHQPDPDSQDRELLFAKLREGQSGGGATLAWSPAYVRFTEVPEASPALPPLDADDPRNEVPF